MKLLLKFGVLTSRQKAVTWNSSSNIRDFPHVVKYMGTHWDWIMFDKDPNGVFDYVLTYGEIDASKLDPHMNYPSIEDMFAGYTFQSVCECGAAYNKGFENVHSYWCPKWEKI